MGDYVCSLESPILVESGTDPGNDSSSSNPESNDTEHLEYGVAKCDLAHKFRQ